MVGKMDCSVCGEKAEPAFSITHRTCGHTTHADCIKEENPNFHYCNTCLNPESAVTKVEKSIEPRTTDGIDYVLNPGTRSKGSLLGSVVSLVSRKPAVPPPKSALDLLREGTPIKTIFQKHKYGLDHMLKEGITIDDFLANKYKWEDLCMFQDVSKEGPHRSLQTFTSGLKMTANHLRDYPDRLPFKAFKELTELETPQLCTLLGMEFPPDGPLQCGGDTKWTAKDCVRFDLVMTDLMDFGLYCVEQYVDLMKGLSQREQEDAEKKLKVTPQLFSKLRNLSEEAKQQELSTIETNTDNQGEEGDEEEEISAPLRSNGNNSVEEKRPFVYDQRFKKKPVKEIPIVVKKPNRLAHLGYHSAKK